MTVQPDIYSSLLFPDILQLSQSLFFFLSCCCYNVNALLSFCEISCQTKQYSKGMGEGTCSSGYMWQNRTSYELFCNYVPVLSLFRGIIDVVLCVTFSQPAYTLITVSFCYSTSEPMLKQSSPNVIFPITNIPNFCCANTPKMYQVAALGTVDYCRCLGSGSMESQQIRWSRSTQLHMLLAAGVPPPPKKKNQTKPTQNILASSLRYWNPVMTSVAKLTERSYLANSRHTIAWCVQGWLNKPTVTQG